MPEVTVQIQLTGSRTWLRVTEVMSPLRSQSQECRDMQPDQLQFERDGITVVHDAFDASEMADILWEGLGRYGFRPNDPTSWDGRLLYKGVFAKLTKFGRSGLFASIATPTVADAITAAFRGDKWHETNRWGQPLITFPTPPPWTLPHSGWHVDFPPQAHDPMPALRMFAYLSDVAPQGGGTLAIAGSHRLVIAGDGRERAPQIRARLARRSDWLRDLWRPTPGGDRIRRFMTEGTTVDGVNLRVVELTGRPGDLIAWHPALLHNGSPNCRSTPRFMLTHTVFRGSAPSQRR
jgi:hypothetical protein